MVARGSTSGPLGGGGGLAGRHCVCGVGGCQPDRRALLLHSAHAGVCPVWLFPSVDDRPGCRHLCGDRRRGHTVGCRGSGATLAAGGGTDADDRYLVSAGQPSAIWYAGGFSVATDPDGAAQWGGHHHHGRAVGSYLRLSLCRSGSDRAAGKQLRISAPDARPHGGDQPAHAAMSVAVASLATGLAWHSAGHGGLRAAVVWTGFAAV